MVNVGCALVRRFEDECPARYLATDLRVLDSVDFSSDATRLPLADDSVDTLITLEMLEHVPDPGGRRGRAGPGPQARAAPCSCPCPPPCPATTTTTTGGSRPRGSEQLCSPLFADGEVRVFGGTFETLGYLTAYYISLLLHVLKVPGRTFRQFFPTVGHAIDRRAGWTTSTSALHTLAFDLLFVGTGAERSSGPASAPPAGAGGDAPEPWAPAP